MQTKFFIIGAALLLLAGCGGQAYTYQDATEAKPGPGLFSGDDGEFSLVESKQTEENRTTQEQLPADGETVQ